VLKRFKDIPAKVTAYMPPKGSMSPKNRTREAGGGTAPVVAEAAAQELVEADAPPDSGGR
jgi:hypothetical protein